MLFYKENIEEKFFARPQRDLNPQPSDPKSDALSIKP